MKAGWGTGALLLLLAGCGGPGAYYPGTVSWDGRRGYDGNGDYGYNTAASATIRAEAGEYRAQASGNYPAPGPAGDPWGPYIQEAAERFRFPGQWIRAVMRQESGGRLYAGDGSLITSPVGAMGLMQVMPTTYDILRRRYGLGADPFEPRDNILAGTAYLREMYDHFGSPYFLAAYNAGPDRVALYLAGSTILPDETENYVAAISPNLGGDVPGTGGGGATRFAGTAPSYATRGAPRNMPQSLAQRIPLGTPPGATAYAGAPAYAGTLPATGADAAYAGGGLVSAAAPTGLSSFVPPAGDAAFTGDGARTLSSTQNLRSGDTGYGAALSGSPASNSLSYGNPGYGSASGGGGFGGTSSGDGVYRGGSSGAGSDGGGAYDAGPAGSASAYAPAAYSPAAVAGSPPVGAPAMLPPPVPYGSTLR